MEDPKTTDLKVTETGHIVCKREGRYRTIGTVARDDLRIAIGNIAQILGTTISEINPLYAGDFPLVPARMQVVLPPAAEGPMLVLRMPCRTALSFDELIAQHVLTASQASYLRDVIRARKDNIAVTGGTGAGKTTFCNAILREIAKYPHVLVLMEDEKELQPVSAPEQIHRLFAKKNFGRSPDVSMHDLVYLALRLDPTIIAMGELREGRAAAALVKAFNTGHRGAFGTWHADSALDALHKLHELVGEGGVHLSPRRIASAITVVVHMEEIEPDVRRVVQLTRVKGYDGSEYQLEPVA
jgi:type IV secretion system protein VirB11